MYRLAKLGNKWYALEIDNIRNDEENIKEFVAEGTPVVLLEDLDDMEELGVKKRNIEIVEN